MVVSATSVWPGRADSTQAVPSRPGASAAGDMAVHADMNPVSATVATTSRTGNLMVDVPAGAGGHGGRSLPEVHRFEYGNGRTGSVEQLQALALDRPAPGDGQHLEQEALSLDQRCRATRDARGGREDDLPARDPVVALQAIAASRRGVPLLGTAQDQVSLPCTLDGRERY